MAQTASPAVKAGSEPTTKDRGDSVVFSTPAAPGKKAIQKTGAPKTPNKTGESTRRAPSSPRLV